MKVLPWLIVSTGEPTLSSMDTSDLPGNAPPVGREKRATSEGGRKCNVAVAWSQAPRR